MVTSASAYQLSFRTLRLAAGGSRSVYHVLHNFIANTFTPKFGTMQDGREYDFPRLAHYPAPPHVPTLPVQNFVSGHNLPQFPPVPQSTYPSQFTLPGESPYNAQSPYQPQPIVQATASTLHTATAEDAQVKNGSGGKTFHCSGFDGCAMSFSRSEHLARHVRKHTGERPFACRCGKKFTRLDNLRQHASTIHADEPEANEELFTRLAANMPRSGRATRRNAKTKQTAQEECPEQSHLLQSPSRREAHPLGSQMSWCPGSFPTLPLSPYPLGAMHSQAFLRGEPCPSNVLPHPVPSPSFRFPSVPQPLQTYADTGYSVAPPLDPHLDSSILPSVKDESQYYANEQNQTALNTHHPSRVQDYGGDGSSFRVTQRAPAVPSRIEHPSTGESAHCGTSTTSLVLERTDAEPSGRISTNTKPTLPSLSSLIAGAPASLSERQILHVPFRGLTNRSLHVRSAVQQRLHSTLLAAAEMASIHDEREDSSDVRHLLHETRSSSFSTSSANTSGQETNTTSPATVSPCSA